MPKNPENTKEIKAKAKKQIASRLAKGAGSSGNIGKSRKLSAIRTTVGYLPLNTKRHFFQRLESIE